MTAARLIKPTSRLRKSHESFIAEFRRSGEELVPWVLDKAGKNFEDYVAWLESAALGIGLPEGYVANSTFWLVDAHDEIVAISNLRCELSDSLMKLGGHIGYGVRSSARRKGYATEIIRQSLIEARLLGIGDMRVTCDKDNLGSSRAIVRNGGQLDEEEYREERGCIVQRYWIRR
jgi:predicted acetyltransferase